MKDNEAVVIAVESQKGGSGKSMLVLNIAVAAMTKGKKVLVIDCDPHMNNTLTYEARKDKREAEEGLQMVNEKFSEKRTIQHVRNFDLETLKRQKIEDVISSKKMDYDYIIIDTAGGLNTKTNVSAAMASHICLFPFNTGKYDLDTSDYVKSLVESIRKRNTENKIKTQTLFRSILLFKTRTGKAKAEKILELSSTWKATHPRLRAALIKREIYEEAQSLGKGVCELETVHSQKAASEMFKVFTAIENLVEAMRGAK